MSSDGVFILNNLPISPLFAGSDIVDGIPIPIRPTLTAVTIGSQTIPLTALGLTAATGLVHGAQTLISGEVVTVTSRLMVSIPDSETDVLFVGGTVMTTQGTAGFILFGLEFVPTVNTTPGPSSDSRVGNGGEGFVLFQDGAELFVRPGRGWL